MDAPRPGPHHLRLLLPAALWAALAPTMVGCPSPAAVGDAPPSVTVLSPRADQTLKESGTTLCARIADPDHSLASLIVRATLDGQRLYEKIPGDGNTIAATHCAVEGESGNLALEIDGLTEGGHAIEMRVTDPTGGEAVARVAFEVDAAGALITPSPNDLNPEETEAPSAPPTCALLRPAAGASWAAGEAAIFEAAVEDPDDAAADLLVRWSADPPSPAVDGQGGYAAFTSALRFTTSELAAGSYVVTATVEDPAGGQGSCAVAFTVAQCVDGDGDGALPCGDGPLDCDDGDASVHPGAEDPAGGGDEDCDGRADEDAPLPPSDLDRDGAAADVDCDDADASSYPGAPEEADRRDNDCDGVVDEGTAPYDDDGDGLSEEGGDCQDDDPAVHPGAPEGDADGAGNQRDDDCDGEIDEGTRASDDDGDGLSEDDGDCQDDDPAIHPGAFDDPRTAGVDEDCDGQADEGALDLDGDGAPSLGGDGPRDCDDDDPAVYPGAPERCDGLDEDCDGQADEDQPDQDGDGFTTCPTAPGGVDCDDDDPGAHPGAPEGAPAPGGGLEGDLVDDDCDGRVDEGTALYDDDGDGLSEAEGDCQDEDPDVRPGAPDPAGSGDEDCDGLLDEDSVLPGDVVITEVRRATYREAGSGAALQWFEVRNASDRDISLAGWYVEAADGHPDWGPSTLRSAILGADAPTLAPGALAVLAADADPARNGGITPDGTYDDLILGLSGVLTLRLGSADAPAVDTVEWDDGIDYPIEEGASLNLSRSIAEGDAAHERNDSPSSWCVPGTFYGRDLRGTPGSPNDPC